MDNNTIIVTADNLHSLNDELHNALVEFAYPEHGQGVCLKRTVLFKSIAVSQAGSIYLNCVEYVRDNVDGVKFKRFTIAKQQDHMTHATLRSMFRVLKIEAHTLLTLALQHHAA